MNLKRLNTFLFFGGVFATAFVIHESYEFTGSVEGSIGAALADLLLVFIAYKIVMRVKRGIANKIKPKSRCPI